MTQRPGKSVFAALAVAGVLLAPATANALPPPPGDLDADGLSDQYERDVSHTKPDDRDTDKDGLNDGNEVQNVHSNPLSKDTDGDGFSDYEEYVDANDRLDPLRYAPTATRTACSTMRRTCTAPTRTRRTPTETAATTAKRCSTRPTRRTRSTDPEPVWLLSDQPRHV
jgi:Bacterial TSP3 repeat